MLGVSSSLSAVMPAKFITDIELPVVSKGRIISFQKQLKLSLIPFASLTPSLRNCQRSGQ